MTPVIGVDSYEESQKKVGSRLAKASKTTNSRLLKKSSEKMNKPKSDDEKLQALENLFWTMTGSIREGDMKPMAALEDFYKGAKAICNVK